MMVCSIINKTWNDAKFDRKKMGNSKTYQWEEREKKIPFLTTSNDSNNWFVRFCTPVHVFLPIKTFKASQTTTTTKWHKGMATSYPQKSIVWINTTQTDRARCIGSWVRITFRAQRTWDVHGLAISYQLLLWGCACAVPSVSIRLQFH